MHSQCEVHTSGDAQGNCKQTPETLQEFQGNNKVALRDIHSNQCIVVVHRASLNIAADTKILIDSIYFRMDPSVGLLAPSVIQAWEGALVYLQSITFQGKGSNILECKTCGIQALSAEVHVDGT